MFPSMSLLKHQRLRFWLMLAGILFSIVGFGEVVEDVFFNANEQGYPAQVFDQNISEAIQRFRTPLMNQAMTDVTSLGSISVIFILTATLSTVLLSYKDFRGLLYIGTTLAGAGIWPLVLKLFFERQRPDLTMHLVNVTDLSFPSGHSFVATSIYLGLAYYAAQYARSWVHELFFFVLGLIIILLVCFSRIYLGVHYPTDVLAGFSGGAAWGFTVSAIFEYFSPVLRRFPKSEDR